MTNPIEVQKRNRGRGASAALFGVLGLFALMLTGGVFYWWAEIQTYHFAEVQPGILYRDGNRGLREFAHAVEKSGAKTVVSLIDDRELNDPAKPQFQQEADYCSSHGIRQIRIPVSLGGWPTSDDLKKFIAIAVDPTHQPVLVHCAQGVRRTGMFVAAYQESVLHQTRDQAAQQIMGFNHKPRDTDDIRTFIGQYDPGTQAVSVRGRGVSAE